MSNTLRRLLPLLCALALVLAFAGTASAANYVALGDSYSAGNGANSANLNFACNRNTYAYPYQVAAQRGDALTFVACSGATTSDVLNYQVGALNSGTQLVTMTIGGNDIGFASLIVSCTTIGCQSQISSSSAQITSTLPGRLDNVYNAIRSRAPNARVVILGYPRPFANRTCWWSPGITLTEESQLNTLVNSLDSVIKTKAQAHGFTYADPNPYWSGHDVCSSSNYTNGLVVLPAGDSYHPTRAGYTYGYTRLVRSIVG